MPLIATYIAIHEMHADFFREYRTVYTFISDSEILKQ